MSALSGVEVLQQWKAEHVKEVHICGRWCKTICEHLYRCQECDDRWPCPTSRLVEQIEELYEALDLTRAVYVKNCISPGEPSSVLENIDAALILSKLGAR